MSQWAADTVDDIILIEGDAMYVKAFDDDTIPDTETLSLTYLPDRVHWPTTTADPAKQNQYLLTASEKYKMFIRMFYLMCLQLLTTQS